MPERRKPSAPGTNARDADGARPRPIPVGWEPSSSLEPVAEARVAVGEPVPELTPPEEPAADEAPVIERPRDEVLVGILAAVLAATVFLPWYQGPFGPVSGWASGTWGPVVFFLALAAIATVVLRFLRVPIAFPVDHSLVLEGIGWVSVLMMMIKRLFPLKMFNQANLRWGMFVALFGAVGLALQGGRVSSGAPFVVRPGWFRARAGKIGTGVLAMSLAAGAAFGMTNSAEPKRPDLRSGSLSTPGYTKEIGFPRCGRTVGFPVPSGVKPVEGYFVEAKGQPVTFCVMTFSTTLTPARAVARFKSALTAAKWKFRAVPAQRGLTSLALTAPQCGTVSFSTVEKKTNISAFVSPCQRPSPQGRPSG